MNRLPKMDKQMMMVGLIWFAFIGSSIVLAIDWKLKQDILVLAGNADRKLQEGVDSATESEISTGDDDLSVSPLLVLYDDEKSEGTGDGQIASKARTRTGAADASRASKDSERLPQINVRMER